jgi:hypothetical protein
MTKIISDDGTTAADRAPADLVQGLNLGETELLKVVGSAMKRSFELGKLCGAMDEREACAQMANDVGDAHGIGNILAKRIRERR